MRCHHVQKHMLRYADGDLPDWESQAVAAHLEGCPECSRLYQKMRDTWSFAKEERIEYQPFLYTRIRQRMNNRQQESSPAMPRVFRLAVQPAIYFIVLGLGIFIGIQLGRGLDTTDAMAVQDDTTNYIEEYAENQYLNGLELEPLEQEMFGSDSITASEYKDNINDYE